MPRSECWFPNCLVTQNRLLDIYPTYEEEARARTLSEGPPKGPPWVKLGSQATTFAQAVFYVKAHAGICRETGPGVCGKLEPGPPGNAGWHWAAGDWAVESVERRAEAVAWLLPAHIPVPVHQDQDSTRAMLGEDRTTTCGVQLSPRSPGLTWVCGLTSTSPCLSFFILR